MKTESGEEQSLTRVTQRILLIQPEETYLASWTSFLPRREEGKIPLCPVAALSMRDGHDSAKEKSPRVEFLQFPRRDSVCNSPSQAHRRARLSFVSADLRVVCRQTHVPNCNSLLFLIKPILLGKYLAGCLFRGTLSNVCHKEGVGEDDNDKTGAFFFLFF